MRYRRGFDFSLRNLHDILRYRLRIYEGLTRNHCHSTIHMLVHIRDPGYVRVVVDDPRVVNVRHVGDIHPRVGDVHIVHVGSAHAVSRHKHFSRSQREPSHGAAANTDGELEARATAHESNEGGRPNRPHHHWPRNPEPPARDKCPAAIVKWSKPPGLVFHLSPDRKSTRLN